MVPLCRRPAWGALFVLLLSACDGPVDLSVDLRTDVVPGDEFTSVWTRLSRDGVPGDDATFYVTADEPGLVEGRRVAEFRALERGPLYVVVSLMDGAVPVVQRTAAIELRNDFALLMTIGAACAGIECPLSGDEPTWTTCVDGQCVDPRCSETAPELCRPATDAATGDSSPPDTGEMCVMGVACDDGDPCTHTDRCDELGACAGTPISCVSAQCVTRTCNGTATCVETFPGNDTECDDRNVCTYSVCDGAGGCVPVPINTDGFQPNPDIYQERCCGNEVVNINTDQRHCGGCWIDCQGRGCTNPYLGFAFCNCSTNQQCRDQNGGPDWTCYDHGTGFGAICNCQSDADCPFMMHCEEPSGPNYCSY